MRNRSYQIERGLLERANRLEYFRPLLHRAREIPDDAAHLLEVQVLGEGWSWRAGEEREEAVQLFWCLGDEFPVPPHHLGGIFHVVKHWAGVVGVNRLRLKEERRHHAEVAAAAADGPEEIRVLLRARGHELAVGEHHLDAEQVV